MGKNFFLNLYKEMRGKADETDNANTSLVLNPYYKGKRGQGKVTDGFTEYSSDNLMKGEIFPGQIYTFVYNAKNPQVYETESGPIEFFDKLPVVLVLKVLGDKIQGINLNMCTQEIRTIILNLICNMDPEFFESGARAKVARGERPISPSLMNKVQETGFAPQLLEFLTKLAPCDYTFIFRTYSISNIRQLNMVEVWQWKYIPHLRYQGSVKQDILEAIWKAAGMKNIKLT